MKGESCKQVLHDETPDYVAQGSAKENEGEIWLWLAWDVSKVRDNGPHGGNNTAVENEGEAIEKKVGQSPVPLHFCWLNCIVFILY